MKRLCLVTAVMFFLVVSSITTTPIVSAEDIESCNTILHYCGVVYGCDGARSACRVNQSADFCNVLWDICMHECGGWGLDFWCGFLAV